MMTTSPWQRLLLSWLNRAKQPESAQGITLIECVMAIAVIALATAMITPPLFIAAATRMQNQRAEQAMQIAQGEVDRVRFLVERQRHTPERLPTVTAAIPIGSAPAPSSLSSSIQSEATCQTPYDGSPLAPTQALQVDITGDCQADFAVQTFRNAGLIPPSEQSKAPNDGRLNRPGTFCFVVRVYAKPAIDSLNNSGTLQTEPASVRFTDGQGNQKTRPLAVITTPMIWSDRDFSSKAIRDSGGTKQNGSNICQ